MRDALIPILLRGAAGAPPAPAVGALSLVSTGSTGKVWGGTPNGFYRTGVYTIGLTSVVDGNQYLEEYSSTSGLLLSSTSICSAYSGVLDNHNIPAAFISAAGSLLTCVGNHNQVAEIRNRRSSDGTIANLGSEAVKVTNGLVTYPQFLASPDNGEELQVYRKAQQDWCLLRSTNDGVSWSEYANPIWADTEQCYCRFAKIGTNLYLVHAAHNPTSADVKVYSFTMNVDTGDLKNGAGTTIANFKTGVPALSAAPGIADIFYTPAAGSCAEVGDFNSDGTWKIFRVLDNDAQSQDLLVGEWDTTGNIADPANWDFTTVCDLGYGVASGDDIPYSGISRCAIINDAKKVWIDQIRFGINHTAIVEKISGNWRYTLAISQIAQSTNHTESPAWAFEDGTNTVQFLNLASDETKYDSIANATVKTAVFTAGTGAPVFTGSSSVALDEYVDMVQTLTADRPCGFSITGGADAALFEIVGGLKLCMQAKTFAAPADADVNNTYVVEVTPISTLTGEAGTPVTITVTVADTVKTGGTNLFTSTTNMTGGSNWALAAINGTGTHNPVFTDPFGGNGYDRFADSTANATHSILQTKTLASSTEHTVSVIVAKTSAANLISFPGMRALFGSSRQASAIFDLKRGRYVGQLAADTVALTSWGMVPLANSGWLIIMTFTTPAATTSGTCGFIQKQFSGPTGSDLGNTAANCNYMRPMAATGKYKDYA